MDKNISPEDFVRYFVVSFGFFEGVWIAVGINPMAELLNASKQILIDLGSTPMNIAIFAILPILLLIFTLIAIYALGNWIGLIAVGSAFIGGLLVLVSPIAAVFFLFLGIILGRLSISGFG